MAVDFSQLPEEVPVPEAAPSPFVGALVFILLTLASTALVIWSWPPGSGAKAAWFWVCAIVLPVCLSGAFVLRRFSNFHKRRNQALAMNTAIHGFHNAVHDAASVPMAVLASAYLLHATESENALDAIRNRGDSPPTCKSRDSGERIVASFLEPAEAALNFDDLGRQKAVLSWVLHSFLEKVRDALTPVPEAVPVVVQLGVHSLLDQADVLEAWTRLPVSVRPSRLSGSPVCDPVEGIGLVDTMLDCQDPAMRDVVTLLISVNLSEIREADPDPGSCEAACMLLLCPESLACETRLSVAGWYHRPQANLNVPAEGALHYALKWGQTQASAIGGVICAGLSPAAASQLRIGLRKAGRTGDGTASDDFALDSVVGNTGPTAPWLASALALHQAMLFNSPYIVGTQDNERELLAVLAPASREARQGI